MSDQTLVSILVPVFNEAGTIADCLSRVAAAPLPDGCEREILVVDDCSTDQTVQAVQSAAGAEPRIRLFVHGRNQGKGAAVRTALRQSRGDICLIQDADLEYDPGEYPALLDPILRGEADVVYGSRYLPAGGPRRVFCFWHTLCNRFLTLLSNLLTNLNLTDMETGFKVARGDLFRSIPIRSNRFGLEPELTAKFSRHRCRLFEVPITYRYRGYAEGKKITWKDGVSALCTIIRFWMVSDHVKKSDPRQAGDPHQESAKKQ